MEFVFKDMFRTVFERKIINGSIKGVFCLIIAIKDKLKKEVLIEYEKNNKCQEHVYSEIWLSREIRKFGTSKEESLPGKDNKFDSFLYLEFCNKNDSIVSMKNAEKNFKNAEIGLQVKGLFILKTEITSHYFILTICFYYIFYNKNSSVYNSV